jgi:hypothetical protein
MSMQAKDAERAVAVLEEWMERGAVKSLVHNTLTEASIARVIRSLTSVVDSGTRIVYASPDSTRQEV